MIVLGIESSCDETAAAVVKDGTTLLSSTVFSSMDLHKVYGGVVPEIAARSHIESIIPVIDQALKDAFQGQASETREVWDNIDAIAVTYGAGLGGSLLVGVTTAKTLAIAKNKPLYGINHVEAHVYANFLTKAGKSKVKTLNPSSFDLRHLTSSKWTLGGQDYQLPTNQPKFPLLALIVSGGHSQLVLFRDHFDYTLLGQTRDDAIGEAFDKVAKIIGLPYPGGPSIAKYAKKGNPTKYKLPKAKLDQKYEYSFSGLKTAVLRLAQKEIGEDYRFPSYKLPTRLSDAQKADIAASFQRVAIETVVDKTIQAFEEFQPKSVVIAGGVAASQELRHQLEERLQTIIETQGTRQDEELRNVKKEKLRKYEQGNTKKVGDILRYTDPKLCTDNGAMIAALGCFKAMHNQATTDPYSLATNPNLSM